MFGVLYSAEGSAPETLAAVAREFSPRIEACGDREVLVDLSGLTRLFGDAKEIGGELRREAAERGLYVRVAVAGTRMAARILAHARAGLSVIEPGTEAAVLAPLPLELLAQVTEIDLQRLRRWGLRTLGDLVALPAPDVAARLGQAGVAWQRAARGEDARPLVPDEEAERFEQALDLEWPIEGLEPLSFVLGRLLDPLSAHLERRDRGAAVLHVRLHLVTRVIHERSLELPTPIRDAKTLRTLALLDLESHPPAAAIDRVEIAVDPTPGRVLQFSLLTRPLPSPEQVSTLVARLDALMGQGRSGSPAEVDSWQPGAFAMQPFAPTDADSAGRAASALVPAVSPGVVTVTGLSAPVMALRRFRLPVPARVRVEGGKPVRVTTDRRGLTGGVVETCAGPWRTSGTWWGGGGGGWDRDEWDVALSDGAAYRVFRERDAGAWFIEGVVD
jgi:protein ImuB